MKKQGFILFQFYIIAVVVLVVMSVGIGTSIKMVANFQTNNLKTQCDVLDRSLEKWTKSHKVVNETSVYCEVNKGLIYERQRLYPVTLVELGEVQNMGYFVNNIDLSQFTYYTLDGGTKYRLEVMLPDGSTYRSPQSCP